MRKILLAFALMCSIPVLFQTGCNSAPSSRVNEVQTLKIVGTSAKASIDAAAQLLKQGQITVAQWQKVAAFYDQKWQPAFNLAVVASNSDLSSIASADLMALFSKLSTLVAGLSQ